MFNVALEADTRILINKSLENLGWKLTGKDQNVFFEQPKTEAEKKLLGGKRPDYVLYSTDEKGDGKPLIVIEAKKKGERVDVALEQGIHYARAIDAPIVFATDGLFCKSYHTKFDKTPILNGEEVDEFLRETMALKFLNNWEVNTISQKVQYDRKQLIKVFDEANNMLRGDGVRAGIERFGEFANILFLKLISENEMIKKEQGEKTKFNDGCSWDAVKNTNASGRIDYINSSVFKRLNGLYATEIFTPLTIKDSSILKEIMDKLDPLTLTDVDSDVKGDAFEYFLKASTSTKNDLGEYFTPRHIVKTMVRLTNPQIGEKVYDPFCGTGGFLIESFRHIEKTMAQTARTNELLRKHTIYGNEITNTARITKMNMILAGDGHSNIECKDSLADPVDGEYDVVLANMPYSQKTKHGKLYDIETTNGDSVCVQHCMRAINKASKNGRMALVVPEGFLFRKDLAKTREYLLDRCELQSIISLPQGVFLPYTGVKTDIIYATKVNQKIPTAEKRKYYWYFDVKNDGLTLDNHRRQIAGDNDLTKYQEYMKLEDSQQKNMLEAGFEVVPFDKVKENGFNLIGGRYRENTIGSTIWEMVPLTDLFPIIRNGLNVSQTDNEGRYKVSRIESIANGYFDGNKTKWTDDDVSETHFLNKGDILFSHINSYKHLAKTAHFSSDEKVVHGANLIRFVPDKEKINPRYAIWVFKSAAFINQAKYFAQRAVNQASIRVSDLKTIRIPLPSLEVQQQIVDELDGYQKIVESARMIVDSYKPSFKIDSSMKYISINDLCLEIVGGGTPSTELKENWDGNIPWITSADIDEHGNIIGIRKSITAKGLRNSTSKIIKKGNVIVASRVGLGKFGLNEFNVAINQDLQGLILNTDIITSEYFAVAYPLITQTIISKARGTTIRGITKSELLALQLPVPSLNVQKKIVAQVESEKALIAPSKQLIEVFEKKIDDRISELFA